ncbi:hypothetical protein B5F33_03550 [Collinsella sp. An2]|nr:hypothetical protein B5F33_03550 [Collinsella sp. An2]
MEAAVAAHHGAVFRLALNQTGNRADAQDVTQEVFIKLMKSFTAFRDADHLRAWLLRVTINQCRDLARQAWKRRVDVSAEPVVRPDAAQDEVLDAVVEHPVWSALRTLKETDRAVLHLRYVEELTIPEIADALSCKQVTVRTRLRRARLKLRRAMEDAGGVRGGASVGVTDGIGGLQ